MTKFTEWLHSLQDNNSISIAVDFLGKTHHSPLSESDFVYYEAVSYWGDNLSTSRIEYSTEKPLIMCYQDSQIEVGYRSLRPYIKPCFEKEFHKSNITAEVSEYDESIHKWLVSLFDDDVETIVLREYGLVVGRKYYIKIGTEQYYLPPSPPDIRPKTRTNTVLIVSDEPICEGKPAGELTPVFQGWGY